MAVRDFRGDGLNLHTDPAAADATLVLERGNDTLHGRGRNRECDADAAAGRRIDRGVYAEHFTFGIKGRAARIALVNGGFNLDEIVVRADADVTAARGHDAGGHCDAEAERISVRVLRVADPRLAG